MRSLKLAYCDFIANRIYDHIDREASRPQGSLMASIEQPVMDLHPTEGWFMSTKKVMTVHDVHGKAYVITVEEAPFLDKD
jgi:hypothetical protein